MPSTQWTPFCQADKADELLQATKTDFSGPLRSGRRQSRQHAEFHSLHRPAAHAVSHNAISAPGRSPCKGEPSAFGCAGRLRRRDRRSVP
jgi:hypothetical protein